MEYIGNLPNFDRVVNKIKIITGSLLTLRKETKEYHDW